MCLLIVLSRVVPGAPLILAGNRDERFDREAVPMTTLRQAGPRTIGGRDLLAGGTWLAVNSHGVVAGLTNKPVAPRAGATRRSRGELPLALTGEATATGAVAAFAEHHRPDEFNPAWLMVGDRHTLLAVDMTGSAATVTELPPGVHVLENRPLGEPSPKVDHVLAQLGDAARLTRGEVISRLRTIVSDHRLPAEDATGSSAACAPARRPAFDAACVHTPEFGTRWSGVVALDDEGSPPAFTYTEGPPCRHPYLDASPLWG